MDLEEEAYNIIRRHKDGVFQNVIWKELDIDSRKCSRIVKKLLDKDLIVREVGVSNGARTYLLKAKEEVKERYDLLLAGEMFSSCTGCSFDCEPEYCGKLSEWIGNLRADESGELQEIEEIEEAEENEEDFGDQEEAEEGV